MVLHYSTWRWLRRRYLDLSVIVKSLDSSPYHTKSMDTDIIETFFAIKAAKHEHLGSVGNVRACVSAAWAWWCAFHCRFGPLKVVC